MKMAFQKWLFKKKKKFSQKNIQNLLKITKAYQFPVQLSQIEDTEGNKKMPTIKN